MSAVMGKAHSIPIKVVMNPKIPILILAYNRANLVERVMQVIQIYQPSRLYLACDGPRKQKAGDVARVAETREAMIKAISWDCEIKTLFREQNIGCAFGVYEAITWFFAKEEYGVILEDDVLVSQDFFHLCEDLLPRYKDEERIMQIVSRNTSRRKDILNTYVYTQSDSCWGWASWRRAWQHMDMSMPGMNIISIPYLIKRQGLFKGCMRYYYFHRTYAHLEQSTSWATRWGLTILSNDGLVICPGVNMGINIGMAEGEHYSAIDAKAPEFRYELQSMTWPIVYNDTQIVDKRQKLYDNYRYMQGRLHSLIYKKLGLGHLLEFLHLA